MEYPDPKNLCSWAVVVFSRQTGILAVGGKFPRVQTKIYVPDFRKIKGSARFPCEAIKAYDAENERVVQGATRISNEDLESRHCSRWWY